MPKEWTGNLIGLMHNNNITLEELGKEIGYGKGYISTILHSKREPEGIQERMEAAVAAIIQRKKEERT